MNLTGNLTKEQQEKWEKFHSFHKGFKHPNILVMGNSGTGKTRSICNLPPQNTKILITEKSTLTFPNAKAFYEANNVVECMTYRSVMSSIFKYSMQDGIKYIVLDSFTGFWRLAHKQADSEASGFAVWDKFAFLVQELFGLIGDVKQTVCVISHSERVAVNDNDGEYEVDVFIEGKKLKKIPIASNFEIVLFCKKIYETEEIVSYNFYTNALRHTPAKSPEGMVERVIPNDLAVVTKAIEEFYK